MADTEAPSEDASTAPPETTLEGTTNTATEEDTGPPPALIVKLPAPERSVGRVIGEMSAVQARSQSVSISCGMNFGARRADANALSERLSRPRPERQLSDDELLGAPTHNRPSASTEARVEVCVELGDALVMACSPGGRHGICLAGHASCEGRYPHD